MVLALLLGFIGAGIIGAYVEAIQRATRFEQMRRPTPQADCKSGAGCCRPRLQADSSWQIECTNDDWSKQ
jgi:hypothetical protein